MMSLHLPVSLSPREEGRGEGEAPRALPDNPAAPPPNPLPAFGGPMVRLSRQRKPSLRENRGRGGHPPHFASLYP
ncbi:hypothetical protein E6C72_26075 [Azospirillum sp. TSH100]|nr:hypothetical protein E6C72_26075 [Azospirillum sp. TSH100]